MATTLPQETTRPKTVPPRQAALMSSTRVEQKGNIVVKWITSTDHKTIGYMYLIASVLFFMLGGVMARIQAMIRVHEQIYSDNGSDRVDNDDAPDAVAASDVFANVYAADGSTVSTDEHSGYNLLTEEGYKHGAVRHSKKKSHD